MRPAARGSRERLPDGVRQQQYRPSIWPAATRRLHRQRLDELPDHLEIARRGEGMGYVPAFTCTIACAISSFILAPSSDSVMISPLAARSLITLWTTSRSPASSKSAATTSLA